MAGVPQILANLPIRLLDALSGSQNRCSAPHSRPFNLLASLVRGQQVNFSHFLGLDHFVVNTKCGLSFFMPYYKKTAMVDSAVLERRSPEAPSPSIGCLWRIGTKTAVDSARGSRLARAGSWVGSLLVRVLEETRNRTNPSFGLLEATRRMFFSSPGVIPFLIPCFPHKQVSVSLNILQPTPSPSPFGSLVVSL